ncbi:Protein CBG27042 [Caenorhabditis briggsae]|uniref:Protein CBG27042 n=1 Tax=Caenorhabditis briggsae TaxID=6238 RepID=B6IMA6_CAEBR|nr:Protein CBG27042 [Caenorhabditis briggsae]CAS01036.1 Protein CBG27042 [Caenorhabditis briggsae]
MSEKDEDEEKEKTPNTHKTLTGKAARLLRKKKKRGGAKIRIQFFRFFYFLGNEII